MKYQIALKRNNEQALAAELLGLKYGMSAEIIYDWANKYNVNLMTEGYRLAKRSNHMGFLCDVIQDRFIESREILGR